MKLAPVTHILPITVIRRDRMLPMPGKILVRAGQKINATEIVGETNATPELILLDIGRALGVLGDKADQYLQVLVGDQVTEKSIIAGPVGMGRRVVRAPRDGKVVLVGGGQILLETAAKMYQLKAGLPGEIVELYGDLGVAIETSGSLVQGVWGNGRMDFGVMSVLATAPDQVLTTAQLDVSLRGAIVLAATCNDPEVLKNAEQLPLRGLILASMDSALVQVADRLSIPVLVLEGFGKLPMNPTAYRLLTTNASREVALNAQKANRASGARPELVIPLPVPGSVAAPAEAVSFVLDLPVRVVRAPYASQVGTIVNLPGNIVLPNGIRARAAEIRLENGQTIVAPLANLEALV